MKKKSKKPIKIKELVTKQFNPGKGKLKEIVMAKTADGETKVE